MVFKAPSKNTEQNAGKCNVCISAVWNSGAGGPSTIPMHCRSSPVCGSDTARREFEGRNPRTSRGPFRRRDGSLGNFCRVSPPISRTFTIGAGRSVFQAGRRRYHTTCRYHFMSRRLNGVYLNEMQGNPLQPDVNFRGYTASPLLGTPEGISVYLDSMRQN
jgi:hypothetical protein